MIEGIKADVTSDELLRHLRRRMKFHDDRVIFYNDQAEAFKDAPEGSSNNPTGSLKASAKQHAQKREFFDFLASRILPGETYRLTHSELVTLEFIPQIY